MQKTFQYYHGMVNPNEINTYLSSYENKSNFSLREMWQGVKTIGAAPARGGLLGMIDLNVWNLAKRLNEIKEKDPKRYEEIKLWFYKLGGNRTKFDKNVQKGKDKRKPIDAILGKPKPKKSGFSACGYVDNEYSNALGTAATVALITAGGGLATAMINKFMGGKAKYQKEESIPETNMEVDPKLLNKFENPDLPENDLTPKWVIPTIIISSILITTGVSIAIIKSRKKAAVITTVAK